VNNSPINYQALGVGLVSLLAVTSYAFMVLRSTKHPVVSTLVIGAAAAFVAVVFGVVVLPYVTFQPKVAPGVRPYTTRELVGRAVYLREGCWYCHSQFVRQQDRDQGPLAEAGQYVYDSPAALGTERTGPDLSNEGGKFPDEWHEIHISHPRSVRPGSIMPDFAYLMDRYPVDANGHRFKYFDAKYQTWRDATDMDCLVLYIQSLGRRNAVTKETQPDVPWEYRFVLDPHSNKYVPRTEPTAIPYATRQIIQAEGMFDQFCSPCHGLSGRGDGYAGRDMWVPPANFTLPKYANYTEAKWFWRISEGIPGAQMPRWMFTLTTEQRWYLVRFLQYVNAQANPTLHPPDEEWKVLDKKTGRLIGWQTPEEVRRKADMADRYEIDASTGKPLIGKNGKPMVDAAGHPLLKPGMEGMPPLGALLFSPAPAGANPGGEQPLTLPVDIVPAALRHPGAPAPAGLRPSVSGPIGGLGIVPGGVAAAGAPAVSKTSAGPSSLVRRSTPNSITTGMRRGGLPNYRRVTPR